MPAFENLDYRTNAAIATVTISRPKALNALNQATLAELRQALQDAADDPSVHGIIVTGAGDKAFVAGADIAEIASASAQDAQAFTRHGQAVFDFVETLGKPVIAAVNGYALGGGCELAMACTLRIASENASFGQPEVRLGVMPGFGGTQRLPRLVGKGRAMQIILTAENIDAHEAHRIGLVNEVVEPARLLARAEEILQRILANAPVAIRLSMEAVHHGLQAGKPRAWPSKAPPSPCAPARTTSARARRPSWNAGGPGSTAGESAREIHRAPWRGCSPEDAARILGRMALSIRVIHDNFLLRTGLTSTLAACEDIDVRVVAGAQASPPDCDIVIADLHHGMHVLKLRPMLPADTPRPRVMIVTGSEREWQIRQVWTQGAAAYLLAGATGEELLSAVRIVAQGGAHLSHAVSARLAASFTADRLTAREDDVLALVSEGLCNKQVACRLGISVATVKTHLRSAFDKLDVRSRAEAAASAGKRGFLREAGA